MVSAATRGGDGGQNRGGGLGRVLAGLPGPEPVLRTGYRSRRVTRARAGAWLSARPVPRAGDDRQPSRRRGSGNVNPSGRRPVAPVHSPASRLAAVSSGLSLLFVGPLVATYLQTASNLALAQGVDSAVDCTIGLVLFWALRIAAQPPDTEHPVGHRAAEPIASLVLAVLAAVLGLEVVRSAIENMLSGRHATMRPTLLIVFGLKVAVKIGFVVYCRRRTQESPVVAALYVDARNDALVGLLAIVGVGLAYVGSPGWDAWLAIPTGGWIIASGFWLARENMGLLMGEVVSETRRAQLVALVAALDDVRGQPDVAGWHHGTHLHVRASVPVDPAITVRQAHDIGEHVQAVLLKEPDVAVAHVHIDVHEPR
ncbi:MAG: cation diffusion facilitator family transporter [Myxococcales bacterium FL481]|nr:MAG: cation diffusion facilitator family transporter [Myxococcales bacterium FL481]